jgi:predicted nuclease of predicted toxin-antitoxin system
MKFIVDAQLPRRLARELAAAGYDAAHTLDLAKNNRTPDREIKSIAILENRVVVTKDEDFVTGYRLHGAPPKLLLARLGGLEAVERGKYLEINARVF